MPTPPYGKTGVRALKKKSPGYSRTAQALRIGEILNFTNAERNFLSEYYKDFNSLLSILVRTIKKFVVTLKDLVYFYKFGWINEKKIAKLPIFSETIVRVGDVYDREKFFESLNQRIDDFFAKEFLAEAMKVWALLKSVKGFQAYDSVLYVQSKPPASLSFFELDGEKLPNFENLFQVLQSTSEKISHEKLVLLQELAAKKISDLYTLLLSDHAKFVTAAECVGLPVSQAGRKKEDIVIDILTFLTEDNIEALL